MNRIAQTREMNPHTKVVIGHKYQSSFATALFSSDAFTKILNVNNVDLKFGSMAFRVDHQYELDQGSGPRFF